MAQRPNSQPSQHPKQRYHPTTQLFIPSQRIPVELITRRTSDRCTSSRFQCAERTRRGPAHSKTTNLKSRHAKQSRRRLRTTDELAREYVHTMTMVGKRATVDMCVSVSNVELDADLFIYLTVIIHACT